MNYNHILDIKHLRKEYHLTQYEISYLLGMSVRNYREKESGKSGFTQEEIMKMIYLFEIESNDAYRLFFTQGHNALFFKNLHKDINSLKQNINRIKSLKDK